MNWVDELLTKIHFAEYYPQGKSTGPNQIIINCPFHDDKHASMGINLATGVYNCFTCNEKGNFFTWCKKQNIDLKKIAAEQNVIIEEKKIDDSEVDKLHEDLLSDDKRTALLKNVRGLNLETIKKFKIGKKGERYSIPIYDINDNVVNIRMYKADAKKTETKVLSWKAGYGSARLFPIANIYKDTIILCEGEIDCLLLNQLGYNAITGTTGVSTFPSEWAKYFTGKRVLICFDIDEAGKTGAARVSELLSKYVSVMKVINLPLNVEKYPGGDVTDYIVGAGNTKAEFNTLLRGTKTFKSSVEDEKYFDLSLTEADHAKYNNKYIRTNGLISGKGDQSYMIPKKLKANCSQNFGEKTCSACPMSFEGGRMEIEIETTDKSVLALIDIKDEEMKRELKSIMGVSRRCDRIIIDIENSLNIEEIVLTTEIEYTTDIKSDEKFVVRQAYYVGHNIESNRSYTFEGKTVSHPKTQKGTHLMFNAKPSKTAIENYKFTDEVIKRLEKFKTEEIKSKIKDMYDSTITHVSGLIGREDLFTLILLSYCSPLSFKFQEKTVKKGYLESLILGDTRTGKTEMMKTLIEYFKLGELVLGESASFAGLVGGLQQMGNHWHLTWGRIPLNNKRLVAIDEMSGLSTWEIGKLSGIRSSGLAEITKIRTERTWARTRLIWMSNPRGTREDTKKMMSSYSQGVRAVPELIGKQEDISRFDLVLLLGINDVDMDLINTPATPAKVIKYKGQEFHDLIMFAWTLAEDDIKFTKTAMDKIYECTKYLSFTYDESIPLIVPSEQRIKLAKIALASAIASFNYDGEKLIVDDFHVQFAYEFLCQIFNKPVCAYDEYSRLEKSRYQILNQDMVSDLFREKKYVVDQLLDVERLTQTDLQEMFNVESRSDTRRILNTLLTNKALRRIQSGYEKTPAFIDFLREHKNGKPEKPEEDPLEFDGELFNEIDEEDMPF